MTSYLQVSASLTEARFAISEIDGKIDGILALIATLRAEIVAGGPVSQEQLDLLGVEVLSVRDGAAAISAKLNEIV